MIFLGFLKHKKKNHGPIKDSFELLDWPDHIISLDGKNFEEFIQKYPISIVDFWASWCIPCRTMAPRLRRLSKIYRGKVAFGKLDTQKNQDIAKKYRIAGIPNIMFFKYGRRIYSITGVKTVGDIKDTIEDILKK